MHYTGKKGYVLPLVLVLIVIVFFAWLILVNSRECTSDADCGADSYCSVDYSCHKIPVIERTVVTEQNVYSLRFPSIVIALGIIAAAIVLKKRRPEQKQQKPVQDYYTASTPRTDGRTLYQPSPLAKPESRKAEPRKVIGSKSRGIYHHRDCFWAKKVPLENQIVFDSEEAARKNSYKPCKVCLPNR
ncbi:MAG: Ada metal-binding domain-containing protein [archaeon]